MVCHWFANGKMQHLCKGSTVFGNFCLLFCFSWILENDCPSGGVLHFLCAQGVGDLPFQKNPQGFAWRGWSGLELPDTLHTL